MTHPGLFGTTPWLDKDHELVGVLFVQSNFLRVMSLVREVQAKARAICHLEPAISLDRTSPGLTR